MMVCIALLAAVAADHHNAFSSEHIDKHDGHHEVVSYGHSNKHHYTRPKYKFEYKVEDHHTKDHKSQHETREHDDVKGYYSLHDPDGSERHVHYHSDKKSGFLDATLIYSLVY
ncbi:hypothetical protein O3G_MSEX013946 [Manduca sexta]|uniref:Cuticle protein n=1 Tax=Manduca sexta TaxID=7130 RepID=A0A922CYV8_MANSE|nr:hypothetical protein O3G_MSEX013946 [Manduca sexta]